MSVAPRAVFGWTSFVLAVAWGAEGVAAPPRFLAAHDILLCYQTPPETEITARHLWVSTNAGRQWRRADLASETDHSVLFTAPGDGEYQLYLVLENDAGSSAPDPEPGATPTATVIVDTTPPLLQVDGAKVSRRKDMPPVVTLDAKLIEENLATHGVRLFYFTPEDSTWHDGGPLLATLPLRWQPPDDVRGPLRLRVVATDRAGNRATSDVIEVTIPRPPQPPAPVKPMQPPTTVQGMRPVELTTVAPVNVGPPKELATSSAESKPDVPLNRLQVLARQLMDRGDYAMAASQLESALAGAPQNPEVLVDLGSALYRLGRFDEAEARFSAARSLTPTHAGALEGLALVAATEKRYADARSHLVQLLEIMPDSGENWMRLGDVEHRLGESRRAIGAWEKALGLPTVSPEVAAQARRRLDFFDRRTPAERSADDKWQQTSNSRPSSSSSATKSTRNP
jgi:Flp pilus assembly protein TadD